MKERDELLAAEKVAAAKEIELTASLESIRKELEDVRLKEREKERALFELASEEREARHELSNLENELERLSLEEAEFKRDIAEAIPLIGRAIADYASVDAGNATREEQEREKRELEKIKIRLEEMGSAGGEEMMKEYTEATEREAFLEKELADLESAAASLRTLIVDLEKELSVKFKEGLDSINEQFTKYFALMFDGGSASLVRVQEPVRGRVQKVDDLSFQK
jgi:chromosome segregation ATPase